MTAATSKATCARLASCSPTAPNTKAISRWKTTGRLYHRRREKDDASIRARLGRGTRKVTSRRGGGACRQSANSSQDRARRSVVLRSASERGRLESLLLLPH